MKIEEIRTDLLKPYDKNARFHSKEQVKQIAASVTEFGFTNPVLISPDLQIIAGHGRVEAAKLLKLEKIPCIKLGHLTEKQRKAYVIADNQIALNASWNMELLKGELEELKLGQFDFTLTGFDESIFNMFGKKETIGATELDEKDFNDFDHECPKCGFEFSEQK